METIQNSIETEPHDEPVNLNDPEYEKLMAAVRIILEWMTPATIIKDKRCLKSMGMRAVAAAWVIDPSRFNNRSLHNIALELGFGANNIAPLTAEFSRQFGITNQFQCHNWRATPTIKKQTGS
jgi:hypothetical protein